MFLDASHLVVITLLRNLSSCIKMEARLVIYVNTPEYLKADFFFLDSVL